MCVCTQGQECACVHIHTCMQRVHAEVKEQLVELFCPYALLVPGVNSGHLPGFPSQCPHFTDPSGLPLKHPLCMLQLALISTALSPLLSLPPSTLSALLTCISSLSLPQCSVFGGCNHCVLAFAFCAVFLCYSFLCVLIRIIFISLKNQIN